MSISKCTKYRLSCYRNTDNFKFKKVRMLVVQDIKEIASLPPERAKSEMAFRLGLGSYCEDEDLLKVILVDVLHGALDFVVKRGFPWRSMDQAVEFAYQFIRGICQDEHTQTDVILTLKKQTKYLEALTDRQKIMYLDYISENVLEHYHLYRKVFCQPRETRGNVLSHLVETPPTPQPLTAGTELNATCLYNLQVAPLQTAERTARQRRDEARAAAAANRWTRDAVQEAVRGVMGCEVMNREMAEKAAQDLVNSIMATQKKDYENVVDRIADVANAKLALKSVPLPPISPSGKIRNSRRDSCRKSKDVKAQRNNDIATDTER